ncbi:antitoxin [Corynebacterium felinum]|uniref:Antitoxin n=1 Tax=Corynebacterium felinum TaxID=131318 RepID=A0ABU2BAD7_9CORY|nr:MULTISPECIES: antitoxin [Corynebacterium]MDF5819713.1 antitoxin [Corynebacterium felinum]MDO4761902.1 antitoxin [Corynebacterium sp.]MDR7355570.1 hypothetical protein [Corynebacterium felinum]WJY94920.1 hypothetical protein CFELI_06515 [Corynebacterium felinum]
MSVFDKAKELLNSEKGEQISDAVLDKAADLAKDKLGADKADKIEAVRKAADEKLGNE